MRPSSPSAARRVAGSVAIILAGCGPPDYADEVAELLHGECASCHRPEGPAPFSLLTYEDARSWAPQIAAAVRERRMPPWLPADVGPAFEGERRLGDEQIETILAWVEAGAPSGDLASASEPPSWPSGWALGEPDLVLTMRESFPVPEGGHDHFRNFVLPVTLDRARSVRAVELRPDNPRVVHHATMRVDPSTSSRLADAADPGPGFDEMFSRTEARAPGGFFLGWTPGRIAAPFPEGTGWMLEPGSDFVVQLHLRPTGEPEEVSVQVGIYFADAPPEQVPLVVRLGGQTMDIPPGDTAYTVRDAVELPVAVRAFGAYPHAHYLGKRMEVLVRRPGADGPEPLMVIPAWDFNWQDAYRFEEPVDLPAGTRLELTWVFDNSAANPLNPHQPPQRVVYGPASADEMAEFWLQVVPVDAGDRDVLAAALARKDLADKIEGWDHLVSLDSTHADGHFGLGSAAQSRGELGVAEEHYRRALAAEPDFAQAHFNLGLIREDEGRLAEARDHYRAAVAAFPSYASAWNALGRLDALAGDRNAAREAFGRAVAADSSHAEALNNLGGVLRELGRDAEAETWLRRALEARPGFPQAYYNLALVLVGLGRTDEGLEALNQGLAIEGPNVQAALSVAWRLATDPDPAVRRPGVAQGLAEQVRGSTGPHAAVADLQAAAFAAAGEWERAVAFAREAVELARDGGDEARARAIEARLRLYQAGRPYTEGPAG